MQVSLPPPAAQGRAARPPAVPDQLDGPRQRGGARADPQEAQVPLPVEPRSAAAPRRLQRRRRPSHTGDCPRWPVKLDFTPGMQ